MRIIITKLILLKNNGATLSITYDEALGIINTKIQGVSKKYAIDIQSAVKHVCAEDIYAKHDLPKYPISLRDGYGIRAKDAKDILTIDNTSLSLEKNTAYELSTGDNLKEGTTAVVPLEDVKHIDTEHIQIFESLEEGAYIKVAGEDISKNEPLLKRGEYIYAYNITALVSQGIKKILVHERPKVSILSIGDNIYSLDEEVDPNGVYNTNALSLAARVLELGAHLQTTKTAKNSIEEITGALDELCERSDFIITTGAMSHLDAMSKGLYKDNFEILFHKVNIAPAGPSALTFFKNTPILHLPGLPLSSLLGFEILGVPTLRVIKNEHIEERESIWVKNRSEFPSKERCTSAIPGYFDGSTFKSAPSFGAGMLNVLAKCNGYALIQNQRLIKKDEFIRFFPF